MLFNALFIFFAAAGFNEPWGKDADLGKKTAIHKEEKAPSPLAFIAKKALLFHQDVISPIDGPRSHFRPTSCRYTYIAIQKFGFTNGWLMGCDRLLRENGEDGAYRLKWINGKLYKSDPASSKEPPLPFLAP